METKRLSKAQNLGDIFVILFAIVFLAVCLLVSGLWAAHSASAASPNTLSDCSDRFKIPTNWASSFMAAVQSYDGTVITDTWRIAVVMDSANPKLLSIYAVPGSNQNNHNLKLTTFSTNTSMYTNLDFTSANGGLYKGYWIAEDVDSASFGSISKYTTADAYARTYQIYCGFGNTHTEFLTANSTYSVTAIAPVKQDTPLGFIDPIVAATSGGTPTPSTGPVQIDVTAAQKNPHLSNPRYLFRSGSCCVYRCIIH